MSAAATAAAVLCVLGLALGWRLIRRRWSDILLGAVVRGAPEQAIRPALEAQRGSLRAIADGAAEGIFLTDDRGRIVYANPAGEQLLGYPAGALIGCDAHATLAPPELQGQCRHGLEGFARDGRGEFLGKAITLPAIRGDGRRVQVELWVIPLWLDECWHAIAVMRDLSERHALERDLDETRQNFHSLVQDNLTGILILDAQGTVQFTNPAAESLLDVGANGLIGQPFGIPVTGDQSEARQTEIRTVRHDGSAGVAAMGVTETRWQGRPAYLVMLHDITERKAEETRIQRLAFQDRLTGLPNRDLFFDRLHQAIEFASREGKGLAVVFMDLDRFKVINDTLGHAMGDALLCAVAERLGALPRTSDTLARWGGDEFTAVFYNVADQAGADRIGKRLLSAFLLPFNPEGHEMYVTPSIGISLFPALATDPDVLVRQADAAMYEAKRQGGNALRLYDPNTALTAESRLEIERDLQKALHHGELLLHYQPQVALASGECVGFEALLRWQRPGCGLVGPATFLPLLESSGLIVEVGSWVLEAACCQLEEWSAAGLVHLSLAINVSPIQSERGDLFAQVAETLNRHAIDPRRLVLEFAESALFAHTNRSPDLLQRLAELGVTLHVDDFGTGYSSFSGLRRLPVAAIKIDERFVHDVVSDAGNAALVSATLTLAHGNGKQVVAEGVETLAQAATLYRLGCDLAQGYYFGRPMVAAALPEWLRGWGQGSGAWRLVRDQEF
ncbi:bifunctional diguanylate cyclase/phosphodiesterase [uncultured Thiodictyon sp.]|uniref:putative bifunctional diguanylate cyclase/phosphodiesterase n=1 Tax=uncultured Thiodictyon sp. TaxID=1846217 RepID=UPI0025E1AB98|nr:bifunctional diguanylate cyclase/phosphodiesterase [uncultured Thiodictyon sp.]